MKPLAACLSTLLLATSGCDAQVDSEFAGDPIASIQGGIDDGGDEVDLPPRTEIKLVWMVTSGSPDWFVATTPLAKGRIPGAFTLELHDPPPVNALNDFTRGGQAPDESWFGIGWILLVPDGVDVNAAGPQALLGAVEDYVVAYVRDQPVRPGTDSASLLGPLAAGYTLMRVERLAEGAWESYEACRSEYLDACAGSRTYDTEREWEAQRAECRAQSEVVCGAEPPPHDQLFEARDGFDTQLELRIPEDPTTLRIADWT